MEIVNIICYVLVVALIGDKIITRKIIGVKDEIIEVKNKTIGNLYEKISILEKMVELYEKRKSN